MSTRNTDTRSLASRCKQTISNREKLRGIFVESVKDDYVESSKTVMRDFKRSPDAISMKNLKSSKKFGETMVSFFGENDVSKSDINDTITKLSKTEESFKQRNKKTTGEGTFFSMSTASDTSFGSFYVDDDEEQAEFVMMFKDLSTSGSE